MSLSPAIALSGLLSLGVLVSARQCPSGSPMTHPVKPSQDTLRKELNPMQFHVTQENGTEPPFQNAYWNEKREGLYVDIVSGEPLFSSRDKFDSGCGWPSFTRPLEGVALQERTDATHGMVRTEVRSKGADSHLGHVFDDGPRDQGGLRYCINSASLRFIPLAELETEGYGAWIHTFKGTGLQVATLAGGCFWGMEELLRQQPGVISTVVGYTGGHTPKATYALVKRGATGHAEAIEVTFDPAKTTYEAILAFFFRMHDPTTQDRQGNDLGSQYRSAIFVHGEAQRVVAEKARLAAETSGRWKRPIVTQIVPAGPFWKAEDDHQAYLQKHPGGYTCHWVRD